MTTANGVTGESTVTLSNPTLVINADGNVVTATRTDNPAHPNTPGVVNINVQQATSDEEIQPIIDAVALQLAQQNAVGSAIVQTSLTATVSSEHGETTVVLHPFIYVANNDGLAITYTLTSTGLAATNINLGTCQGTDQSALDAYADSAMAILQSAVDAAAQAARDSEDAAIGISDLQGNASASVTL